MSGDVNVVRPVPVLDRTAINVDAAGSAGPTEPDGSACPTGAAARLRMLRPCRSRTARSPRPTRMRDWASSARSSAGEIDVAEAGRRFEALDGGEPLATPPLTVESIDPGSETTRVSAGEPDDA